MEDPYSSNNLSGKAFWRNKACGGSDNKNNSNKRPPMLRLVLADPCGQILWINPV